MNSKHLLIAALLAGAFSPALAWQNDSAAGFDADTMALGDSDPGPGHGKREHVVMHAPPMPMMEHVGPGAMQRGRTVKNAPYSAEAVNESQRTLADGNQISTRTSTMSYRDSAGRVRQEVRDDTGAVRSITINDPVDGSTFILRPEAKTAVKIGPHRDLARLADKAKAHAEEARAEAGRHVIIKRVEREAEREARNRLRDSARRQEDVRIMVDKDMASLGPLRGLDRLAPALSGAFGDMKWSSKATTKDLGTKEIDGIKAQGKLRSYEIPAGDIGNRNPIVVSSETWYAPDLQVTLMTRHSDPRSGERTYRLSNIKREEPAAALFTVPSDYTVKDTMAEIRKFEFKKEGAK